MDQSIEWLKDITKNQNSNDETSSNALIQTFNLEKEEDHDFQVLFLKAFSKGIQKIKLIFFIRFLALNSF